MACEEWGWSMEMPAWSHGTEANPKSIVRRLLRSHRTDNLSPYYIISSLNPVCGLFEFQLTLVFCLRRQQVPAILD
ncbi:MAG: hypothetical protein CL912_33600 [Deltaproteobacteria bacterium]|nr:hypothetical protein [Deltaproteobacteria bacterium]